MCTVGGDGSDNSRNDIDGKNNALDDDTIDGRKPEQRTGTPNAGRTTYLK